jgi:hypothetical protein
MIKSSVIAMLFSVMLAGSLFAQSNTIGDIDFFGYQGLDVAKVRAALPVHTDDRLTDQAFMQIVTAVVGVIGKPPTGVEQVCCDPQGRMLIYIGLPGGTYKPFTLNPAPTGNDKLPPEIAHLYDQEMDALFAAVAKGGQAATEDTSQGYALSNDPATQALQLQQRAWALEHEPELKAVLRSSSDANQRKAASHILGYAKQSREQLAALVHAARDPDSTVRNNATRALAVLVHANPKLAADIEPDTFLAMHLDRVRPRGGCEVGAGPGGWDSGGKAWGDGQGSFG